MHTTPGWRTPRHLTEDQLRLAEEADTHLSTRFWPINALIAWGVLWRGLDWPWWQKLVLLPWIVLLSAWTTPTTRSTGNLITAGIWNTDLVDNLIFLHDRVGEQFVPWINATASAQVGDWWVASIPNNTTNAAGFMFVVPENFASLVECYILLWGSATSASYEYDVLSDYGDPDAAEAYNNHSGSAVNQVLSLTANQLTAVSISAVVSALAVGDHVGILFFGSAAGAVGTMNVAGLVFRYNQL